MKNLFSLLSFLLMFHCANAQSPYVIRSNSMITTAEIRPKGLSKFIVNNDTVDVYCPGFLQELVVVTNSLTEMGFIKWDVAEAKKEDTCMQNVTILGRGSNIGPTKPYTIQLNAEDGRVFHAICPQLHTFFLAKIPM